MNKKIDTIGSKRLVDYGAYNAVVMITEIGVMMERQDNGKKENEIGADDTAQNFYDIMPHK